MDDYEDEMRLKNILSHEVHVTQTSRERNDFSFCRELCETEVCFLHIELIGTNV